jgi:hypothetical protein
MGSSEIPEERDSKEFGTAETENNKIQNYNGLKTT